MSVRNHIVAVAMALAALAAVGCSKPAPPVDPEVESQREGMRIWEELRPLIGLGKDEFRAKLGAPSQVFEHVWRERMWGPGEGLGKFLKPGQAYEEWRWRGEKLTPIVFFADLTGAEPDRAKWKAIAVVIHHEGAVY